MTELLALGAITAAACLMAAIGFWAWIRLSPRRGRDEDSRNEPMTRLIEDADLQIVARWDRTQRRVVRVYLRETACDFRRLHAEARALVAESPEQYSDLVGVLMRQQVTFLRAMAGIEIRLALSAAGLYKRIST